MKAKKIMALIIAAVMVLSIVPMTAFAEIGDGYGQCPHHEHHTEECGYLTDYVCTYVCEICLAQTEALINALPSMEEISEMDESEKDEVFSRIDEIDRAKLNLSDSGREEIDWTKYDEACFVLYMPDGYFGGASYKKDCIDGVQVPLNAPQFAFLNEAGEYQNVLFTDLNTEVEFLDVDENGKSGFFYLPEGTYEIREFVDGDWTLSMKVNGVPASDNTFTGVKGGIYEIDLLNSAAGPLATVIVDEIQTPYINIEDAVSKAQENEGCTLKINRNYTGNISIPSGKFDLDASGVIITGTITIGADAEITVKGGTFRGETTTDYCIVVNEGKIVIEDGDFGLVDVDGVKESRISGGTFRNITSQSKGNGDNTSGLKLTGGKFLAVKYSSTSGGMAYMNGLLDTGYAFKTPTTWIADTVMTYNDSLNYAEVVKAPIQSVSINTLSGNISYDDDVEMKITSVTVAGGYDEADVTYKWRTGTGDVTPEQTNSTYTAKAKNPGVKTTYYCDITLNGYKITKSFSFTAKRAQPLYVTPTNLTAIYGQTLGEVVLPEGFSWEQNPHMSVGDVGERDFSVKYTPSDLTAYEPVDGIPVKVDVKKAPSSIDEMPKKPIRLVYTKSEQELYENKGQVTGGTIKFSFSETGPFNDVILKGKDAKNYRIYYMVVGDSNHENSAVGHFDVEIEQADVAEAVVELGTSLKYTGYELTQTVSKVSYQGVQDLTTGDYTVTNNKATTAGDHWLTITGKGNYKGTQSVKFTIAKAECSYVAPTATDVTYTGSEQALINGGSTSHGEMQYSLSETTGFSTEIPEATNADDYTVYYKVIGDGNHENTDVKHVEAKIKPKTLTNTDVSAIADQTYTGSAITPSVTLNGVSGALTLGTDYTVGYENNINAGTAKAKITILNSNYTGTPEKEFVIKPKTLTNTDVSAIADQTYTGYDITPNVTLNGVSGALTLGTDYTVGYENNINAGTAKAKITILNSNYTGTPEKEFTIKPKTLTNTDISAISEQTYKGSAITPSVTLNGVNGALTLGTDYTVGYEDNLNVGTAKAKITILNFNYTGTPEKEFTIKPKILTNSDISAIGDQTYTGFVITPSVTLNGVNGALTLGTDYTVGYENNLNAGTAKAKITILNSNYTGTPEKEFTIKAKPLINIDIEAIGDKEYTGSEITPDVVLKDGETTISSSEYIVNYENNKNVGTARVTVTNKTGGNYTFSTVGTTFKITELDITGQSVTIGDFDAMTYNGTDQIPRATVKLGELNVTGTWSAVKNVSQKTVFTANGNFKGITAEKVTGMSKAEPIKSTQKPTTAKVKKGKTLSESDVRKGDFFELDGQTLIEGTLTWDDATEVITAAGTKNMTFAPTENENYKEISVSVPVSLYSSGSGGTIRYTVKFESNGGSAVENQSITKNYTANEPDAPTKEGFVFDGWFTDEELTEEFGFGSKITKNITLYAKWTKDDGKNPIGGNEGKDDNDGEKNDGNENKNDGKDNGKNPGGKPSSNGWENPFDDVKDNDWFFEGVKFVSQQGLMSGTSSNLFSPNRLMTRAMLVTILYRAEGSPKVSASVPFADVSSDSYYADAVIWAEYNGIVHGVSATSFAPDENITREQIAVILYRYAEYKGKDVTQGGMQIREYSDFESISEYAITAVAWAVNTGLMKGKTEVTLNPKDNATRAEFATIFKRFAKNE